MWHISTDEEFFFDVLPSKIPCEDPEILQFYLCGHQPPLSILNDEKTWFGAAKKMFELNGYVLVSSMIVSSMSGMRKLGLSNPNHQKPCLTEFTHLACHIN